MAENQKQLMRPQELYDHLAEYLRASPYDIAKIQTRYYLEAEGMKFASRRIGLDSIVQNEIYSIIDKYVCIGEALKYFKIPAPYLFLLLNEAKPRTNDSAVMGQFAESLSAFAHLIPSSGPQPGPFDLSSDAPYINLQDHDALEITKSVLGRSIDSISEIIGTGRFIALMAVGSSAREYIHSIPSAPNKIQ